MNLQLEHLAPYLPYELNIKDKRNGDIWVLDITRDALDDNLDNRHISLNNLIAENESLKNQLSIKNNHKPILRPLSDLTQVIKHNGEYFIPAQYIPFYEEDLMFNPFNHRYISVAKLFEWHFDVFGLIDGDLAIDINKLK